MHDHHNHCAHILAFCEKCDRPYCKKCSREWYEASNGWTWQQTRPYWSTLTSGGGGTNSQSVINCSHEGA